ncbi:MAG: hypothetical protein EAZ95_04335 [Bacteroidetes bacterium]|nr:MAG: hypothetical protein EAZ95_04335 [Bacteroidota bacterium]
MDKFLQILLFSGLYAILNTTGAGIIKTELKNQSLSSVADFVLFLFRIKVILAFGIILVSALMMFKALSLGKFSLISPIATGINFCLTIAIGYFFFHDKLTFLHFVGLFFIFAGIFLVSIAEK